MGEPHCAEPVKAIEVTQHTHLYKQYKQRQIQQHAIIDVRTADSQPNWTCRPHCIASALFHASHEGYFPLGVAVFLPPCTS